MKILILAITFVSTLAFASVPPTQHSKKPIAKKAVSKKQTAKKPVAAKAAQKPQQKPVYKIAMDVAIDGIKTSSSILTEEGKTASIESSTENLGGRFQEVIAHKTTLEGKPALQMEFVIGEVDRFGNRTVVATPKIISTLNEKSTVLMGSAAGGKKLVFSATAIRTNK